MSVNTKTICEQINECILQVKGAQTGYFARASQGVRVYFLDVGDEMILLELDAHLAGAFIEIADRSLAAALIVALIEYAGKQYGDGYQAGKRAGHASAIDDVHKVLGIDKLCSAIMQAAARREL